MGQNNKCLHFKSGWYNVQEERILVMEGSNSALWRLPQRRPRLRSAFDAPASVDEESVVLKQVTARRRVSHPDVEQRKKTSRRGSVELIFGKYGGQSRGASLKPAFEASELPESSTSRRNTSPSDGRRTVRTFWNFRSLYGRHRREKEDKLFPHSKSVKHRRRSSSLGQTTVIMAHPKHRPSGSTSPDTKLSSEKRYSISVAQTQLNTSGEYESGHPQPASVESLVRRCASCFDDDGECQNNDFPGKLFLTHAWFMTSEQLAVLFSQLYGDENTPTEMKKQVLYAIRFWMKEFPQTFDLDATLVEAIKDLQSTAAADDEVDASLLDLSNRGNYRWPKADRLSVRPPQGAGRKRRKVSLVFNHLEPEELAIHISYLEFKCFKRLTFGDFHKYALHATIKDIARLERCVFLFNNITFWVQCMVLGQHTPQERAAVITKFIKIAQKLREMHNYNTLMAVVGGLTHTAIARLKKTMSALHKDAIKVLDELVDLLDSRCNYAAYRREYAQQESGFKIPVLGVHMKDIISVHTAMSDRVGDGLINVKKMLSIAATFQELLNLQRTPFPHEVNKDLVNTLRVSLYLYYTEEEIYSLSLQREPRDTRNSVSSANSPSKLNNMVFAEFTKFTCQLDNDTVSQHVTAMVKSVFKAYDHDNDGFISEEEFDSFKDNFPMMESFSAMDVDRDGRISRSEMCDYFMKASACRRNDFCQNFTHEFAETTYFHPTFCQECQKLLWGLVKQGWKCKGCGINCHKHCKDRIVQECRPKQTLVQTNNSHVTNAAKRNGTRDNKSSVSSESDLSANGDAGSTIANSTSQNRALDDEAFDSPSELVPSLHRRGSPAVMRRSTSLASADVPPRSLLRKIQDSKTPSPTRKVNGSPDHGGRKSFVQKIMTKRSNSNKSRLVTNSCTQTPPQSPSIVSTPQYPATKSFLYPRVPDTPKQRSDGGRLGSTGEELEDNQPSHLNNNHAVSASQSINGVAMNMENLHMKGHGRFSPRSASTDSFVFPSTPKTRFTHDNKCQITKRDSGLSGCSLVTEFSYPATPLSLETHSATSCNKPQQNAFRFPPFSSEDAAPPTSSCRSYECAMNMQKENARLREVNSNLEKELSDVSEYVKLLEEKLKQNGLPVPERIASNS